MTTVSDPEQTFLVKITPRGRIGLEPLARFTRQLAVLLAVGMPLLDCLEVLKDSADDPKLANIVDQLSYQMDTGFRFSQALRTYPYIFSKVYVGLVEVAEETGQLDTTLLRLALLVETELKMRQKVTAALIYPGFLLAFSFLILGVFLVGVLPTMQQVFENLRLELPWCTKVLLLSRHLIPVTVLGALTLVFLRRIFRHRVDLALERRPKLNIWLSSLWLRIPIVGGVVRRLVSTQILGTLESMIAAGLPWQRALHNCQGVTDNAYVADQLVWSERAIKNGNSLSDALACSQLFYPSTLAVVTVGEESAAVPQMLRYAARIAEEETTAQLGAAVTALEPILLGVLGLLAGFIVIGTMLPIVQLIQTL